MKRRFARYLMPALFVTGFLACGDSHDGHLRNHEQEAQSTPTPQTQPTLQPEIARPQIDVDAVRTEIQEVIDAHFKAIEAKELGVVMSHWVKSEKTFFVNGWGPQVNCTESWEGVKRVFEDRFQLRGHREQKVRTPETIEAMGIDSQGKTATIHGRQRGGELAFDAIMQKDRGGKWRFLALDPIPGHKFNHCKIKQIETIKWEKPK